MLQIGRPERGVGIGGVAQQGAQLLLRAGPLVQTPGDGGGDADLGAMRIAREVDWIEHGVDGVARQVPQRGGPNQGEEEIGSRLHAVPAERIAEGAAAMRQALRRRNIDQAAQADGGVEQEPRAGLERRLRPQLKSIVHHHARLGQIDQNMMQSLADRTWGDQAVDHRQRTDYHPIHRHLHGEAFAVQLLEGIAMKSAADIMRRRRVGRGRRREAQNQAGDDHLSEHSRLLARPCLVRVASRPQPKPGLGSRRSHTRRAYESSLPVTATSFPDRGEPPKKLLCQRETKGPAPQAWESEGYGCARRSR